MTTSPAEQALLDPFTGILAVVNRGQATGTNKFSLLLALIDLAPLAGPDRRIPLRSVAEEILRIHWDQVAPFEGDQVLSQVTSGNRESTAVTEVQRLHGLLPPANQHQALDRVRDLIPPQEWEQSVRRVRKDTVRNPVKFLQKIDGVTIPFLYRHDAAEDALILAGAAADVLARYGPALRELIQLRFVRLVLNANSALQRTNLEARVEEHLFGSQRQMPGPSLRSELAALQGGTCLYTGAALAKQGAPLDHVMPWARVRLSVLGNLVVTTKTANSAKSDLLPSLDTLAKWVDHLHRHEAALTEIAEAFAWPAQPRETLQVAARIYRSQRPGAVLWSPGGVHAATGAELRAIDELLSAA